MDIFAEQVAAADHVEHDRRDDIAFRPQRLGVHNLGPKLKEELQLDWRYWDYRSISTNPTLERSFD